MRKGRSRSGSWNVADDRVPGRAHAEGQRHPDEKSDTGDQTDAALGPSAASWSEEEQCADREEDDEMQRSEAPVSRFALLSPQLPRQCTDR